MAEYALVHSSAGDVNDPPPNISRQEQYLNSLDPRKRTQAPHQIPRQSEGRSAKDVRSFLFTQRRRSSRNIRCTAAAALNIE
jgi:hypothetical protein